MAVAHVMCIVVLCVMISTVEEYKFTCCCVVLLSPSDVVCCVIYEVLVCV